MRTLHQILHLDLDIQYSLKITKSQELVKFNNPGSSRYICIGIIGIVTGIPRSGENPLWSTGEPFFVLLPLRPVDRKFDTGWRGSLEGHDSQLLSCYIMRMTSGKHTMTWETSPFAKRWFGCIPWMEYSEWTCEAVADQKTSDSNDCCIPTKKPKNRVASCCIKILTPKFWFITVYQNVLDWDQVVSDRDLCEEREPYGAFGEHTLSLMTAKSNENHIGIRHDLSHDLRHCVSVWFLQAAILLHALIHTRLDFDPKWAQCHMFKTDAPSTCEFVHIEVITLSS